MVKTVIGGCPFDGQHITHVGHHAKRVLVATRVAADGTHLGVADVVAPLAQHDVVFHLQERVGQLLSLQIIAVKQMQGQTQGCLLADARQLRQ